jgi:hypothetical protein
MNKMRTSFAVCVFFFATYSLFSQNMALNPVVDERVELLSIVFRLAGSEEYMNNDIKIYSDAIDSYFDAFKNEEVIKFAQKISQKQGVAYDAVMSMAINLELENGTFRLKKNIENTSLDGRWKRKHKEFISLLNKFYTKTDFHKFYLDHEPLYAIAEKRFSEVSETIDLPWVYSFFGIQPDGGYNLVISLVNGGGNYGPKVQYKDSREDLYSIIGSWETDSLGFPVYSTEISGTIIHEFCHSFCNQLGIKYYPEMKAVADKFYELAKDKMHRQAYGNACTMLNEILVRASVIKYFQAHHTKEMKIKQMISYEQANGFIWIDTLVKSLTEYEASRKDFPTLEKYMPNIVLLQNSLVPEELIKETDAKRPQIVSFSIRNNSEDVDPATKELTLTFDRPMYTRPYGMSKGKCGDKCWPKITSVKWNQESKNELIIYLELEPDHFYSMRFPESFMMDENGFIMKETYTLDFKTKK